MLEVQYKDEMGAEVTPPDLPFSKGEEEKMPSGET